MKGQDPTRKPGPNVGHAVLAGVSLLLAACSPVKVVNGLAAKGSYERTAHIEYGSHGRQKLDVYTPGGAPSKRPVVVFFYGGAWQKGSRTDYIFAGEAFASKDIVAVVPDYRIFPEVAFPAFVEDGASAVKWVQQNIAKYGGDPCKIFLAGHSAGAHIAALLHYDKRYLLDVGAGDIATAGFIGIAGPYNFLPLTSPTLQRVFPEATRDQSQPVNFVDGSEAPALVLHGESDRTVWPQNSQSLAATVLDKGGVARSGYYKGVGHVRVMLALARGFRWLSPTREDVTTFVLEQATEFNQCESQTS